MSKLEALNIPQSAIDTKPHYRTRQEADAAVPSIKSWIRSGNQPYLWEGHTHTHPPATARPIYLDEFELSQALRDIKLFSPCPCCTPNHPKFGTGRIAWFPEESVIRLIGPRCFASLNKDAHDEAENQMRREIRRRNEINYLLNNTGKINDAILTLDAALPIAIAVDKSRQEVLKLLEMLRVDLWPLVKYEGTLLVARKETEIVTSRDGTSSSREFEIDRTYAKISGFRLFDPTVKSVANRMRSALQALRQVDFVEMDVAARIRMMSDEHRHQMAKLMDKGLRSGRAALSDLDDLRRGMSITTTATLRNWSLEPGTKLPGFYIRREDSALYIGRSEYTATKIHLNREFNNTIPEFTTLSLRPLSDNLDGNG